uniref:Immunoglobulin V-set domain-containing protein n=1 Tax=Sinocyclocheilus anshuiensis TaxID=1608454 RepID=A0A671LZQ7_9TELE
WKSDLILALTLYLFSLSSGFSAEISVFVQTGASVQLDIQTQELPEFYFLSWSNYKSENIVTYISATKEVIPHLFYKDRVDFNKTTFSLTLKNMQKTDSGQYRAKTSGQSDNNIVTYRVSVMDEVEGPVLAINSSWSSPDPCSFTCKGSNIFISSIYNGSSCSQEEVTSADNHTLRLSCSGDSIMCNYSNPVSSKTQVKKVNELCTVKQEASAFPPWIIVSICLFTLTLAAVISFCIYKGKKGTMHLILQLSYDTS